MFKLFANADRRISNERMHSLVFNQNPNPLMVIGSRMGDCIIHSVNERLTNIIGWTVADLEERPISVLSRLGVTPLFLKQLTEAASAKHTTTYSFKCRRKNGDYFQCKLNGFPLDDSGSTSMYLLTLKDIEQDLNAKSYFLNWVMPLDELTTFITTGLLTINTNGYVSYSNARCLDFFGLNRWDLVGKHLSVLDKRIATLCVSDTNYVPIEEDLEALGLEENELKEKKRITRLELPTRRILQRVVRKGKYNNLALVYYSDITASKEIEESKSNYLATAAHELRSPMTCILGFVELLKKNDFDKEKTSELLNIISGQAHAMANLLNELLDLARIEENRGKDLYLQAENIEPIIKCVIKEFSLQAHRLTIFMEGQYPAVRIDKMKILRALSNIINNSIKYSLTDSKIHIFIKKQEENGIARKLGIVIRDKGIGMTPEELENFGKPFWRASPSGSIPGTGLGISLAKEIVKLHEGQFEVISERGKGTEITVWLPVA